MTSKRTTRSPREGEVVKAVESPRKVSAKKLALAAVEGTVPNAAAILSFSKSSFGGDDLRECVSALREQASELNTGDLRQVEAMLAGQAVALNLMFGTLAGRASSQKQLEAYEGFMRMALKAQNQCRATLETMAMIKNPRSVAFVRQANLGHCVQVNNGAALQGAGSRAAKSKSRPSKLMEHDDGEWLDSGATEPTGSGDPALEALGKIQRTKNR